MMSGSVFLSNLDDFIAPSQACVNPLVASKLEAPSTAVKGGRVTLSNDYSKTEFDDAPVKPNLINVRSSAVSTSKVASVSLNDCLACSGCVTSAETVLIQEQSYEKLLYQLHLPTESRPDIVVAISPNSIASLANFLALPPVECFLLMASALKGLGARYVVDTFGARDIALVEARTEFLRRHAEGQKKQWEKPATTTAVSSTRINVYSGGSGAALQPREEVVEAPALHSQLPVLCSHCPGWVCYAEKSQPQSIPYISTVKSAQQILGTVMKHMLLRPGTDAGTAAGEGSEGKQVYFVSIQPCFDKKLEASRLDFYHSEESSAEVDLVLSTTELWRLLEATAVTTANSRTTDSGGEVMEEGYGEGEADELVSAVVKKARLSEGTGSGPGSPGVVSGECVDEDVVVLEEGGEPVRRDRSVLEYLLSLTPDAPRGRDAAEAMCRSIHADGTAFLHATTRHSGSGGYVEYLFKYAAQELYGVDLWALPELPYKEGRNPDMVELDINAVAQSDSGVESAGPARKLKFARAYGFRNIQSVMMKMRRGQCDLDFVEIMACPSGCNNGGGQIRQATATAEGAGDGSDVVHRENPAQSKERVAQVEAAFHSALQLRRPEDNPLVQYVYAEDRLGGACSAQALAWLHTRYHAVPKLDVIAPLAAKW